MELYLIDSLIVEATGCIVGVRTESAIFTGGRVSIIIKGLSNASYCPVLLESGYYRM